MLLGEGGGWRCWWDLGDGVAFLKAKMSGRLAWALGRVGGAPRSHRVSLSRRAAAGPGSTCRDRRTGEGIGSAAPVGTWMGREKQSPSPPSKNVLSPIVFSLLPPCSLPHRINRDPISNSLPKEKAKSFLFALSPLSLQTSTGFFPAGFKSGVKKEERQIQYRVVLARTGTDTKGKGGGERKGEKANWREEKGV